MREKGRKIGRAVVSEQHVGCQGLVSLQGEAWPGVCRALLAGARQAPGAPGQDGRAGV